MKSRLAALSALSLALLLTGCTQYTWVKPGLSDAEMHKKVTGSSSEKTDKKHKKQDVETSYTVEDANEYQRETLVDSCMFKSGWDKVEVQ